MRPHFSLQESVAPANEPVTKDEVKAHLRMDPDDTSEDALLDAFIAAARIHIQNIYGLQPITSTWVMRMDRFPGLTGIIELPRAPVASVTSIQYVDIDDTTQTLSSSTYQVDVNSLPARIALAPESTWPTLRDGELNAVIITFVAGYGSTSASVPQVLKQAYLLLIGHMYEHREDTQPMALAQIPYGVKALLANYRLRWF